MSKNKGFTLVEVVIVLTVMALLAVAALPRVIDIVTQAKKASRDEVVAAARSGIHLSKINTVSETFPTGNYPFLDAGAASGTCGTMGVDCFIPVIAGGSMGLNGGTNDSRWAKTASNTWRFDSGGSADSTYTYNMAQGTLLCTAGSC